MGGKEREGGGRGREEGGRGRSAETLAVAIGGSWGPSKGCQAFTSFARLWLSKRARESGGWKEKEGGEGGGEVADWLPWLSPKTWLAAPRA